METLKCNSRWGENISTINITDKGLISRKYEEFLQISKKNSTDPVENEQRTWISNSQIKRSKCSNLVIRKWRLN